MALPRLALPIAVVSASLWAQLIPPGAPVPHRDKPPVVFLNGYQNLCVDSSFGSTFGIADQVLQANAQVSLFFDNCSVGGKPSIEELGAAFGTFIAALKYDDGQPVTFVDAVAHSMGGLILRSYLSGKQPGSASFQPPPLVPIRKAILIATPNFGTPVALQLGLGLLDTQVAELGSASSFLFDLATWNQDTDDLRGVDALAIVGNGGTGKATGKPGFDDGVVPLTSGSLGFALPGRTRVLPFCHTDGGGLITFAGLCDANAKGIANIRSASDPQAQILLSFLNDTAAWRNLGVAAENDPILSNSSGLQLEHRTAADAHLDIDSASAGAAQLALPTKSIAYNDLLPSGPQALKAVSGAVTTTATGTLAPAVYKALVLKPGPILGRVYPAASVVFPLTVAPGEFIAIYGDGLAGSTAQAPSADYPTQLAGVQVLVNDSPVRLYYVSTQQIDAVLPDSAGGLTRLTVQNAAGSHTINLLLEPAVPAIFTQDGSGAGSAAALNAGNNSQLVTPGAPLRAGDFVELFLTGLGAATTRGGLDWANQSPTVTIAGQACPVTYAGRAPGYLGLDQINCQLPSGIAADPAAPVIVYSGQRASNIATLAVQ